MKRTLIFLFVLAIFLQPFLLSYSPASADTRPAPEDMGASGMVQTLRRLQTIASMLHTGAHPDDESTDLLAYLARGTGARVAYLSLNRGEGGQNGIGPELGEALGVIRTEELLASRKIDGAEQYFTRAFDFGFTRSAEETFQKWNREELLEDMVRVIRSMRPLVIVSGFSGTLRDGHGQHQVAGLLTPLAIKDAADPNRFPQQITKEGLEPWAPLKVYGRIFGPVQGARAEFDAGVYDPVIGRSYGEIANDGRSHHRSQDTGAIQSKGTQPRSYPRLQSSVEAPEMEKSIFAGIDTSIVGIAKFAGSASEKMMPGLQRAKELAAKAMNEYRSEQPVLIAPYLATGLREIRALRAMTGGLDAVSKATVDGMLALKEAQFSDGLVKANGVIVDALSNTEIIAPGESVEVVAKVYLANKAQRGTIAPDIKLTTTGGWKVENLQNDAEPSAPGPAFFRGVEKPDVSAKFRASVPDDAKPTQPYWLTRPRTKDQFDWDSTMPRTFPFAPPLATAQVELTLNGERVTIRQPVEYRFADKTFGEIRRELKVAPALTLTVRPSLLVIPAESQNRTREISVEITHNAHHADQGSVKLIAPPGWKVESDAKPLSFTRLGEKAARSFRVTPPDAINGAFELKAVAESDTASGSTAGKREFTNGYRIVSYPHIEPHFIYHSATTKIEVFDVKVASNLKVGYVMGSGDDGLTALSQMGVNVHQIDAAELASGDLSVYDTIVLGIRVYEVNDAVIANNKRLLDYVAGGGTLIVQYNKNEFSAGNFAPYPVKMNGSVRITDENAPITVLEPDNPLFNFPNKITASDWNNWIQERGLYFLTEWDNHYTPLLSGPDDEGKILKGGELIAQYGKGTYIFTSYAWFRQFPAGVPGAYRLFANLVSYSKRK